MDSGELISACVMIAVTGLGVVINVLTVCVILGNKALRKRQHVFTCSLAVSDGVASATILVQHVVRITGVQFLKSRITEPIFNAALITSILNTLAIAIQRFIVLRLDPFGNRNIVTANRAIAVCVIIWFVVFSAYILVSHFLDYEFIGYVVSPLVVVTVLVITVVCYVLIYRKVASASRDIGQTDTFFRQRAKLHTKIILTFAIVVGTTAVGWLPMCAILLTETYAPDQFLDESEWFSIVSQIGFSLVALNGFVNPVIYWFRLSEFRNQLTACCRRHNDQGTRISFVETRNTAVAEVDESACSNTRLHVEKEESNAAVVNPVTNENIL